MGESEKRVVQDFLEELLGHAWDDAQVERIVNRMAPNARYHVYAWERPICGEDAIRRELQRQAPLFRDLRSDIVSIASTGGTVLLERVDSMTVGRKPLTIHIVAVFEVNSDGKIESWREYYDSKEVNSQLGADVTTAGDRA